MTPKKDDYMRGYGDGFKDGFTAFSPEEVLGKPTAWVVKAEPDFKWHFALSKEDAEHTAHNFLTYAKGCTSASIAPLFAGKPIPIAKRTY